MNIYCLWTVVLDLWSIVFFAIWLWYDWFLCVFCSVLPNGKPEKGQKPALRSKRYILLHVNIAEGEYMSSTTISQLLLQIDRLNERNENIDLREIREPISSVNFQINILYW